MSLDVLEYNSKTDSFLSLYKETLPATLRTVVEKQPEMNPANLAAGKFLFYPNETSSRVAEGGLRLLGKFKKSQENAPLVTVITVCLNSAKTIEETFNSIFFQDYDNIEYIVIDAVSTDGTLEIIKENANKIDYFISEPDKGLYDAMNKGLSLASGDYILILNSDDSYSLDAISSLVEAQKYSGCDFVSAQGIYMFEDSKKNYIDRHIPFDSSISLTMPLRHETMLLSAEIYNIFGNYDTRYKIIADWVLSKKLYDAELTLYEIPRPLLNFSRAGVSSINLDALNKERKVFIKENFPFLEEEDLIILSIRSELTIEKYLYLLEKYSLYEDFTISVRCDNLFQKKYENARKDSKSNYSDREYFKNMPKVSIILPVYNAENTLPETFESIITQTLSEFEVLCIDDFSEDSSRLVIEQYMAKDARIKLIPTTKKLKLGGARNKGIREAKGEYVFHIDPDDTMPSNALELLYAEAVKTGADMIKGAYTRTQKTFSSKDSGNAGCTVVRTGDKKVKLTTLSQQKNLLASTEGHWSYLYKASFVKSIPYPDDIFGMDSLFIVKALCRAKKIAITPHIVYNYLHNTKSAVNTMTVKKVFDTLELRYRYLNVLRDFGHMDIARSLLLSLSKVFYKNCASLITDSELWKKYILQLKALLLLSTEGSKIYYTNNFLEHFYNAVINEEFELARSILLTPTYNVATLSTLMGGGASIGSKRRIQVLGKFGHNISLFTAQSTTNCIPIYDENDNLLHFSSSWKKIKEKVYLPLKNLEDYCSREFFSIAESLSNFKKMQQLFDDVDLVHLHWVVGIFDYKNAEVLANKPVVWTCADMNPFTGGCHYSEGCEEYQNECMNCKLLGGESKIAHESWKTKKEAYAKLNNLQIICPSQWLANCAAKSSLFKDRPIHVIPNAQPIEDFNLINKVVARKHLNLPVDKKLFLFGAESLDNKRKGGDLLIEALEKLYSEKVDNIEIVLFGNNKIKLPYPTHNLGFVNNPKELARIYSAVDAFLFPSLEDNAPLTIAESLLCGTPVIAFPIANVPELIEHKKTGYIASAFNINDFAQGIRWSLNLDPVQAMKISMKCRIVAKKIHDPYISAMRHTKVYSNGVNNRKS